MGLWEFTRGAVIPIVPWAAVFAAIIALTAYFVSPGSLIAVVLCCLPAGVVYVAGVARFGMTNDERKALIGFVLPTKRVS
jgi:hypothetical protein